ncbi:hypothetical protein FKP32DRAFT_1606017 [Trametes sanguinea]|nr:hypothetical protein FKP32DRAFT_1606017 [Trametes sanguinea]
MSKMKLLAVVWNSSRLLPAFREQSESRQVCSVSVDSDGRGEELLMRDRSTSPQKASRVDPRAPWYVTLGKGRSGKTQTKLFCPGGKYADPFPIVFKVPNEDLANEILTYWDAIKMVEAAADVYERVRVIYTLPVGDTILKQYIEESPGHGLYPVCWGNECAIFLNIDDARNATKAVDKPIWRKVPCFRRALAFMVSGGESEKTVNTEFRILLRAFLGEPSAFGFDVDSKLLVAYACKHSDTMEDFVRQVASAGVAVLEAKYMWTLYTNDPPSGAWSETHIIDLEAQCHVSSRKRMAARREAADAQRKYVTRLSRKPYRTRRKLISIKKTPAEKKAISAQREERHQKMSEALAAARETVAEEARKMQAEFGLHSDKYFEQQILQHARVSSTKRKTNRWNAFLRNELQKKNNALPAGAPRYSSSDKEVISEISAKWKALSDEEKIAVTEDLVKELDEQKEMKALAVQSVPISAFHDVRATLDSVFEELRRLHARTGVEIGLAAVRSARHQFTPPMIFATSSHVHDFFQISLGTSMDDVACSLEAYCLSGVSGLVQRSVDVTQDLRSRLTAVIHQKLGQATQYAAKKMVYVGFAEQITGRHGVVIDNWPLPRFLAPSNIRTRLELTTLLSAWETDTTRFRKLSRDEWEQWQQQHTSGSAEGGTVIRPVSMASFVAREAASRGTSASSSHGADTSAEDGTTTASGSGGASDQPEDRGLYVPPAKPRKRRSDYGKSHKKHKTGSRATPVPEGNETSDDSSDDSSDDNGQPGERTRGGVRVSPEHGTTPASSTAVHAPRPPPIITSQPPVDGEMPFQANGRVGDPTSSAVAATPITAFGGGATFLFPPSYSLPAAVHQPQSTAAMQGQHEWHIDPNLAIDPVLLNLPSASSGLTIK